MMADSNEINSEDAIFSAPEPWETWETKLVLGCIGIGIAGLIILGWLVNKFILV